MLTITILLTIAATLYVIFPLIVKPSARLLLVEAAGDDAIRAIKTDKELYLKAIKDIDFEYASDKINEDDYNKLKKMYSMKAYESIEKIEELEHKKESEAKKGDADE